jgi:hypothetical protein
MPRRNKIMPTCANLRDIQRAIRDNYESDNYGSRDDYPDHYYDIKPALEREDVLCSELF